MSWDTLSKDNLEYLLSKLKTDVLDNKVDTEAGKGLSTNDYTTADKNKLAGIAEGAEVNVQSDWNQTSTDADDFIKNKPTIPDAQIQSDWNQTSGTAKDFIKNKPTLGTASALDVAVSGDASSSQVVKGDDSRLSDARTPVSHTHTLSEITDAGTAAAKNSTSSVTAGSTDLVESGAVKTAIDNAVSGAYKHAGIKTCAELISSLLIASNNGNVYNITDSGTTTSDFIEGAGIPIRAGDNVGIAKISDSIYKFDLLSGFIDTSNFVTKSSTSGLIKNDGSIDTTEYAPASSIPAAQIQSDWSQSDNTKLDYIKNKPTLGTAAAKNVPSTGDASTSEVVLGNDSRLTDARNAADVYEWAKASTKPSYSKSEVGLGNVDNTSDSTKKSNFTGSIASENTGFVTGGDAYTALNGKVDKVDGKGLSSNDYTTTEKNKLAGIASGAEVNVQSDWNQTNTSSDDYIKNKPANLVQDASYVHTDNNYTTTEKNKLAGIASGAEVNVQSDWNQTNTGADDYIKNKPTKLSQFTNDSGFTKVQSSTTNGNIKIDTVETQVYDDSEIQNLVDTSLTETEYVNPLSLITDNAQNAVDTKIKLLPIQDLHGYDKPWVGGAGKNKLPMELSYIKSINTTGTWSGNTYSIYGITITILVDNDNNVTGIETSAGTPTSAIDFRLYRWSNSMGTMPFNTSSIYNLSGCPANGSNSTYKEDLIYYKQGSSYSLEADVGRSINLDFSNLVDSTELYIRIVLYTVSQTKKVYYPMLRLSSVTDVTFEPYTNICPISGHDQINVLGCGKNLCDLDSVRIGIAWNDTHNSDRATVLTPILGNATYTLKVNAPNNMFDGNQFYVVQKDANNVVVSTGLSVANNTAYTFIAEQTARLFVVQFNKTNIAKTDFANTTVQLEIGSEATEYVPYAGQSNNLSIDLPSTVYGGVLDLESGELVVDRKLITLTTMTRSSATAYYVIASPKAATNDYSIIKANKIETAKNGSSIGIFSNLNGDIRLNTPIEFDNASDMIAFYGNEINVCYKLATPITIQLTPSQLYLLKNQNNLTTSQYTQIKVVYRNGVFALLDPATETTDGLMSAMDKLKLDGIDSENISLDLLSHAIVLQRT